MGSIQAGVHGPPRPPRSSRDLDNLRWIPDHCCHLFCPSEDHNFLNNFFRNCHNIYSRIPYSFLGTISVATVSCVIALFYLTLYKVESNREQHYILRTESVAIANFIQKYK